MSRCTAGSILPRSPPCRRELVRQLRVVQLMVANLRQRHVSRAKALGGWTSWKPAVLEVVLEVPAKVPEVKAPVLAETVPEARMEMPAVRSEVA